MNTHIYMHGVFITDSDGSTSKSSWNMRLKDNVHFPYFLKTPHRYIYTHTGCSVFKEEIFEIIKMIPADI